MEYGQTWSAIPMTSPAHGPGPSAPMNGLTRPRSNKTLPLPSAMLPVPLGEGRLWRLRTHLY